MNPSARTIIELNIKHFRALLKMERDEKRREMLVKLLTEEEHKLAEMIKRRGEDR